MGDDECVGRREHDLLIKTLNGNLAKIDHSIDSLHKRINKIEDKSIGKGTATIITILSIIATSAITVTVTMFATHALG